MISNGPGNNNPSEYVFTVDLGRPSIVNEQALKRYKQIHDWVKTSNTPVGVLRLFYIVDNRLTRDEFFQGGNDYRFGFKTAQDRDAFLAAVEQAKKDYPPL